MATPTAVIFDNDGLLLDTETVWTRGEQDLFARRGVEFTDAHKLELVGTSAHTAGAVIARQIGEPGRDHALVAELDEIVFAALEHGVEPMAGALELVAELRGLGVPIGLVSNSPRRFIERSLDLVGLGGAFGTVISAHEVAVPKPAPDAYLAACEQLAIAAGPKVVVLEDSPTGVAAGRAAGLTVFGIPSLAGVDLSAADAVFGSLLEAGLRERLGLS